MIITHLRATNWRNFQQIDVPLTVRQFIVGPNASGKSNLLDIFRFLQDIAKNEGGGLQEAVAGRGGVPIIRNLVTEQEAEIAIDISLADTLQRDESYRSRPAPASTAELFRCTRYLDDVRRDRGSIETDTTPDRRRRFPTKFLPPLNLSLGDGTQNDH